MRSWSGCWGRRHIFLTTQRALTVHVFVYGMLCGHSKLTITVLWPCVWLLYDRGGGEILSATSDLIKFYERARDIASFCSRHNKNNRIRCGGRVLLSYFQIYEDCHRWRPSKYQTKCCKLNSQMKLKANKYCFFCKFVL